MKASFYLASRYQRRSELARYAATLRELGHKVTSEWLLGIHENADDSATDQERGAWASIDLRDVDAADWLIAFTGDEGRRGGYHVEYGYALAKGKKLIVVGPRSNVFHCLRNVPQFDTWAACLAWIVKHTDTAHPQQET